MFSNTILIILALNLCLATYVRFANYQKNSTVVQPAQKKKKSIITPEQYRLRRQPTYQYSYKSVPSLTSSDSFFSEVDKESIYDASYSISSEMPFSIPGTPDNKTVVAKDKSPQQAFDDLVDSFKSEYLQRLKFTEKVQ